MKNRDLLIIIAVLLAAVVGFLAYDAAQQSPGEQIADDFNEMTEEVSDEIDDNM